MWGLLIDLDPVAGDVGQAPRPFRHPGGTMLLDHRIVEARRRLGTSEIPIALASGTARAGPHPGCKRHLWPKQP
jgi:hypothetical protein